MHAPDYLYVRPGHPILRISPLQVRVSDYLLRFFENRGKQIRQTVRSFLNEIKNGYELYTIKI
jgi:hypothetical protein